MEKGVDISTYYHVWCDGSCHHTSSENWMGMGIYHKEVNIVYEGPITRSLAISGPKGSHNEAEYLAVLCALTDLYIIEGTRRSDGNYIPHTRHATIYSDSQLIIRQLTGEYSINKKRMQILYDEVKAVENLLNDLEVKIKYEWNPRTTENQKQADWLSKCGNKYFKDIQPDDTCSHGIIELEEVLLPGSYNNLRRRLGWGPDNSI